VGAGVILLGLPEGGLGLLELGFGLAGLILGSLDALLVVEAAYDGQFSSLRDLVAGLYGADAAVGSAYLVDLLDESGGFEGEVDLLGGQDGGGVAFGGVGVN
jgi:hypothetical protein